MFQIQSFRKNIKINHDSIIDKNEDLRGEEVLLSD